MYMPINTWNYLKGDGLAMQSDQVICGVLDFLNTSFYNHHYLLIGPTNCLFMDGIPIVFVNI